MSATAMLSATTTTCARTPATSRTRTHARAAASPSPSYRRTQLASLGGCSLSRSRALRQVAARAALRTVAAIATEAVDPTSIDLTDTLSRVRGNTGGAMMVLEDATVTIGNNDLIHGVDWKMMKNERCVSRHYVANDRWARDGQQVHSTMCGQFLRIRGVAAEGHVATSGRTP
jgi:hypothetical protein